MTPTLFDCVQGRSGAYKIGIERDRLAELILRFRQVVESQVTEAERVVSRRAPRARRLWRPASSATTSVPPGSRGGLRLIELRLSGLDQALEHGLGSLGVAQFLIT